MIVVGIRFRDWEKSGSHRIWILCENLWQQLHDHKEISISLDDADKAREYFSFEVRRRFAKRAINETRVIVERHFMTEELDILIEDPAKPDDH